MSVEDPATRLNEDEILELTKQVILLQKAQYHDDPVQKYINSNSLRLHPAQEKLIKVHLYRQFIGSRTACLSANSPCSDSV